MWNNWPFLAPNRRIWLDNWSVHAKSRQTDRCCGCVFAFPSRYSWLPCGNIESPIPSRFTSCVIAMPHAIRSVCNVQSIDPTWSPFLPIPIGNVAGMLVSSSECATAMQSAMPAILLFICVVFHWRKKYPGLLSEVPLVSVFCGFWLYLTKKNPPWTTLYRQAGEAWWKGLEMDKTQTLRDTEASILSLYQSLTGPESVVRTCCPELQLSGDRYLLSIYW